MPGRHGGGDRTAEACPGTAVRCHAGLPVVPIRRVLPRDPRGRPTPALPRTEPESDPLQVARRFVRRWRVEVTFREARDHLGVETRRQWSGRAVARATPRLPGLLPPVAPLAARLDRRARAAAWCRKPRPTFADALAAVRRRSWRERGSLPSWRRSEARKLSPALRHGIASAPCRAARTARAEISGASARACPRSRDRSPTSAAGARFAAAGDRPVRRYALRDDQRERAGQGPPPGPRGARGRDGEGRPPVRGGGAVPLPRRHPLARPAGAVRRLDEGPHPLSPLGEGRRAGENLPAPRRRGGRHLTACASMVASVGPGRRPALRAAARHLPRQGVEQAQFSSQRRNQPWTVRRGGQPAGRARQGPPARRCHAIAPTTRRVWVARPLRGWPARSSRRAISSTAYLGTSPFGPGSCRARSASVHASPAAPLTASHAAPAEPPRSGGNRRPTRTQADGVIGAPDRGWLLRPGWRSVVGAHRPRASRRSSREALRRAGRVAGRDRRLRGRRGGRDREGGARPGRAGGARSRSSAAWGSRSSGSAWRRARWPPGCTRAWSRQACRRCASRRAGPRRPWGRCRMRPNPAHRFRMAPSVRGGEPWRGWRWRGI